MKIKTGDNVKVLSGRDKGKTGKVLQVIFRTSPDDTLVVVEGANMRKKHMRARSKTEKGQTLELAAPLNISKVMLIDPGSQKPTRVGYGFDGKEKKRLAKRSGQYIV